MFNAIRSRVVSATRTQTPWTHDGLIGERVVFKPMAAPAAPAVTTPTPSSSLNTQAAQAWPLVKDSTSIAALEAFVRRYGETFYGDLAKARLAETAKKKGDDDVRAKAEMERQRVATEQRKQEVAMLQQEEQRKAAEAEAARKQAEAANTMQRGRVFRDCPECPEMVVVPSGSFMMGSPANEAGRSDDEGPQRRVTIAKPFAVGKFEVTFAEWDACVSAGGCKHKPETSWGRFRQPVMNVSWDDTKSYTAWLSSKTGKTYRLLTESEWEYAARAGTTTPFATGPTIGTEQANYNGNFTYGAGKNGQYRQKTVDAGSFPPNAFGLHDMHGNVWEWVEDCYKDSYAGAAVDGSAVTSADCSRRVVRGGSWDNYPLNLRSANRKRITTVIRSDDLGFRVGRTLP